MVSAIPTATGAAHARGGWAPAGACRWGAAVCRHEAWAPAQAVRCSPPCHAPDPPLPLLPLPPPARHRLLGLSAPAAQQRGGPAPAPRPRPAFHSDRFFSRQAPRPAARARAMHTVRSARRRRLLSAVQDAAGRQGMKQACATGRGRHAPTPGRPAGGPHWPPAPTALRAFCHTHASPSFPQLFSLLLPPSLQPSLLYTTQPSERPHLRLLVMCNSSASRVRIKGRACVRQSGTANG